jgi:hypothetical protein
MVCPLCKRDNRYVRGVYADSVVKPEKILTPVLKELKLECRMENKMKNDIEKLLQKEMDRKGFLRHVGIGFAAIIGVTAVLKTLNTMTNSGTQTQSKGYGMSAYGGASPKSGQKLS